MILARIGSGLCRTGRILMERPRTTLWTLAAPTCALLAAGIAALAADHLGRWTTAPGGGASMVVYLGEGVDEPHAQALVAQLGTLPGVEHAELVPAAQVGERWARMALEVKERVLVLPAVAVQKGVIPAEQEAALAELAHAALRDLASRNGHA